MDDGAGTCGDQRGGDRTGRSVSVVWRIGHTRSRVDSGAALDSGGRRRVWRGGPRRRVVGMRVTVGTDSRGPDSAGRSAAHCAWQPRGDSMLTGGPGAERGRLAGGSHVSVISELKFTPG
jgi:hypothetical protein